MSTPRRARAAQPETMNESPASVMIAAGTMMLAFTIASGSRFGRMCRNMIRPLDAPITRAASTYAVPAS